MSRRVRIIDPTRAKTSPYANINRVPCHQLKRNNEQIPAIPGEVGGGLGRAGWDPLGRTVHQADQNPLQDDEPPQRHHDGRHLVGEQRSDADTQDGEQDEDDDHPRGHRRDLMEEGGE